VFHYVSDLRLFSLLDELDEDLLVELDEVIRSNQRAHLPVSRGGEAEAELLSRVPDLAGLLAQSRQRRIDAMALRSRFDQDEERFVYPGQPKFGSLERSSPSASTLRIGRKVLEAEQTISATASPVLKAKDSANDMIFDMDDEQSKGTPSRSRRFSSTSSIGPDLPELAEDSYAASPIAAGAAQGLDVGQIDDQDVAFSSSLGGQKTSDLAIASNKGKELMSQASTINTPSATRPWDSARFQSIKVDMKEILAQSSSQTSNISLGMATQKDRRSSGTFTSKLSQKERKKLQQQHQQQQQQVKTPTDTRAQNLRRNPSDTVPKSPWQTPQKGSLTSSKDTPLSGTGSNSPNIAIPSRGPGKTPLTMRQTIPGNASPKPPQVHPQPGNLPIPASPRPSSSGKPATPPSSTHNLPARPSQPPQPSQTPSIQSIRHTPLPKPSSSFTQLSMADILAQQQSEKDTIKEIATAKRSLQDIQQEQEFQEWWEQESAKVKAEQEAADAAASRSESSRGRGKGRGRGRGQGGGGGMRAAPSAERRGKGRDGGDDVGRGGKGKEKEKEGP
jgi:hypothetical protein